MPAMAFAGSWRKGKVQDLTLFWVVFLPQLTIPMSPAVPDTNDGYHLTNGSVKQNIRP